MSFLQSARLFLKSLVSKQEIGKQKTEDSEMRRNVEKGEDKEFEVSEDSSIESPVYLVYATKTDLGDNVTYCMTAKTNQFGCYTTYRNVVKDFPIPDPHDKAGCELFLGYPLLELYPKKHGNENRFGLLTVEEKNVIQGKLDEGFACMKENGRDFHHVVLQTELQADWAMSRTPKAKRTTDLCIELTCEKDTYKIEDKVKSAEPDTKTNHSNPSYGGYGYANAYRSQNTRYDGKRWDFDKKEWVEDVPKPNHPVPVLLEGEKLVEIPEA